MKVVKSLAGPMSTTDEEPLSIDWLLWFQPRSLERKFQTDTSKRRIRSAYRVDFAMFVGLALFMACGWPQVYDKGRCLWIFGVGGRR